MFFSSVDTPLAEDEGQQSPNGEEQSDKTGKTSNSVILRQWLFINIYLHVPTLM